MSSSSCKQVAKAYNRHKFTTKELLLMSLLAASGMACKPLISPIFNLVTDFIRIPGGSCTAGFSLLFLVLGKQWIPARGTATMMSAVQALLAVIMGLWSASGIYILVSYLVPGIVIDLVISSSISRRISKQAILQIACALGVISGAAINNILVFRLTLVPAILFYLLGAISGILGGRLAGLLYQQLSTVKNPLLNK